MKKNTVKMFVAGFMLAAAISANAQTAEQRKTITKDYDKEAMRKMANDFTAEWDANYAQAKKLAELNGWPLHYTEGNNSVRLVGVKEDGSPLYFTTLNANAAFSSGVNSFYNNGALGVDLTGTGMEVGIWDEERPRTTHVTFSSPGSGGGRFDPIDSATEMTTHPTHVGGTVLGNGVGSTNLNARGMAYTAHGYSLDWNNDIAEMTSMAENAGLLVSNHSYGAHPASVSTWEWGAYNTRSRQYDVVAFAAKNYLIVKAAGNDRGDFNIVKGGYDLINGAATSKNVLTVAAVQGLSSAYTNPSQVVMSSFSSWGPSDDRRIKPDISAKGVNVFSSVLNGSSNTTYGNLSGTSMASPVVTGGALLLQQLYMSLNGDVPMRSATLKGLICHTADEAGPDDGPDPMFGWGLFDAKRAGQAILDRGTKSIIEENSKAGNSQNYSFNVLVAEPGTPLQVSITWTDPAGNVTNGVVDATTRKLINDLDVRVSQGDVVYFPWRLTAINGEAAERGDNIVDNVERIDVPNASGQYTVTVSHKGNLVQGPQQYSLIVTNASKVLSTDKDDVTLFSVWPNPANAELNINLVESGDANVAFYDVQGREVLSSALTQIQTTISTAQLSGGVYMVRVSQNGKQQLKKVIVNK